ncbi:MAG: class I SAM-dependent rRNA methyltransferase [Pseudomonadota bacterium]
MNSKVAIPVVVLKQGRDVAVRRRHPWVFSGAVADRHGTLQRGCFVEVRAKDGSVLGCGHWGTKGIAIRMLAFGAVKPERDLVRERISMAVGVRRALGLIANPETTGFRLIHGEGDGLPGLVIDIYGDVAVVQCHSAGMWRLREDIAEFVRGEESLRIQDVVFKRVEAHVEDDGDGAESSPDSALEAGIPEPAKVVAFSENGLRFMADVTAGQKTGFFLDQRVNRLKLKEFSAGKHVLNAFCYTGAFSVYAFAGGAESVTSVDTSKAAIDLCRQNVVTNFAGAQHNAEVADCFQYLTQIPDTFDLIVLDPPAFAKHQRAIQRGLRGYETINTLALKKIKPGGVLFSFSCSQLISREVFRDAVMRAAVNAGRFVRVIDMLHQAPCHPSSVFHPEGDYLKGLVMVVE